MTDIANLREMLGKATKGPWVAVRQEHNQDHITIFDKSKDIIDVLPWMPIDESRATAELIVALVNAAPSLLAACEAGMKLREHFYQTFRCCEGWMEKKCVNCEALTAYDEAVTNG